MAKDETNSVADATKATEAAIKVLRELLAIDPKACRALVEARVDANEDLVKLGSNLLQGNKKKQIGLLGVLNSVLQTLGGERVGLVMDNDECVDFVHVPVRKL